jgi:acyl-CoA synthetase (AMP-forming)/AMP-acid ligase II
MAIARKFSTSHFWEDVRHHGATIIQYVGETCRYLLSAPPSLDPETGDSLDRKHSVRIAFGNGLRPDVWNRFKERFGIDTIAELYGETEGHFMTLNLSRNDFSMGAVGRTGWLYHLLMGSICSMIEVDYGSDLPLRDAKTGFCRKVKTGETGELLFRLPADISPLFQGYYGNETATGKKILRDVFRKGDVWFRTGDVLRWDGEGRLFFIDRIGDTFRWKSENVSTAEVSQVVGLHPAVREANVYGVKLPHHEGRAGCAAIVLEPPGDPSDQVLRTLAEHVRKDLPNYARPIFLRILKEANTPATGTNKQMKHALREQGVSPTEVGSDTLFWLKNGTYVRFGDREWSEMNGARLKL